MKNLLALLLLVAVGCAHTPPPAYNFDNSRTYPKTKREVWDALVDRFAANHIAIRTIEWESGLIVAENEVGYATRSETEYYSCQRPAFFTLSSRVTTFNVLVTEEADASTVSINLRIVERGKGLTDIMRTVICRSKGVIEEEWLDFLA